MCEHHLQCRPRLTTSYSNGMSEIVLGKAIKDIGMPRVSIVVLTKVSV
jgi:aryl-alcohol dehydrogenase-like predicted oxidoreductase